MNKKISTLAGSLIILAIATTLVIAFFIREKRIYEEDGMLKNITMTKKNENNQTSEVLDENKKEETDVGINKSDIPNWKKDFFSSKYLETTNDWSYFEKTDSNEDFSFSIEYPEKWSRNGNVFANENKLDVMIISQYIVMLKEGQKCFDKKPFGAFEYVDKNGKTQSGLFQEENIRINERDGSFRITKGDIMNNYYTIYCLMEKNKAFLIKFPVEKLDEIDKNLYEKILSTIEFEE